jgi:hypothetical protein
LRASKVETEIWPGDVIDSHDTAICEVIFANHKFAFTLACRVESDFGLLFAIIPDAFLSDLGAEFFVFVGSD